MKKISGFTLIELLIVLGIVAVLSTVVVVALNPTELLKQGRDSTRISDLNTINNALNLYATENSGSYGAASTTYISIPDTSPTCANLGLPTSTTGYLYHCVTTATLKNTDGTGWIPMDLRKITAGSPITSFAVDPTNTTSGGFYYTFNTPGTSWQLEMTIVLESQKYQSIMQTDGGVSDYAYEIGSNFNLAPGEVLNRASSTYVQGPNNPAPVLSSISPTSTPVGGGGLTLTVNGSSFVNSSVVNFNGAGRTTTFASSSQITASILSVDVAASGTYPITVTNPTPGGGTSGAINLTVQTFGPSGSWATDSTSSPAQGIGNSLAEVNGDIYMLVGNSNAFRKYSAATKVWTTLATTTASVGSGGALVKINNDTIYAFQGGNTTGFWKYIISSGTWATMAVAPGTVGYGGALTYPGTGDFIYAFRGNSTSDFWKYSIANNSWGINGIAQGVGNSIAEVSGKLYVLNGNGNVFQKFNPATYTWTTLATTTASVGSGGALVKINNDTIYAFQGGNTTGFWKYIISTNTWTTKATTPGAVGQGGALTYPGTGDFIYAFRGNGDWQFWKYSMANNSWGINGTAQGVGNSIAEVSGKLYVLNGNGNVFQKFDPATYTWTTLATTPISIGSGAALVKTDTDTLYALRGAGTTSFWKYGIGGNSWTVMASSTSAINYGGALAYPGTGDYIYAFIGNSTTFLKYSIGGDSWSGGTAAPAYVAYGGALTAFNSTTLYGLRGNNTQTFWLYNIASGTWTGKADIPAYAGSGATLTNDGTSVYATRGVGTGSFYSYNPGTNIWTTLPGSPVAFGNGNAEARAGIAYSSSLGSVYGVTGNGTAIGQSIVEYNPSTSGWPIPEWSPAVVSYGGALTAFNSNILYSLNGSNQTHFAEYNIASGTWTGKADIPAFASNGASLTNDGASVYASRGYGSGSFYSYNPGTNIWTTLPGSPVAFGNGNAEARGGIAYSASFGSIYGVTGNGSATGQSIVEYGIGVNGWPSPSWTPYAAVSYGGALTAPNSNTLYSLNGGNQTYFAQYNIETGVWTGKTGLPAFASNGASLTNDGASVYASRGYGSGSFYSYNPGTNAWTVQASIPVGMGNGNAEARGGISYSSTAGAIYAVPGANSTIYKLLIVGQ